MKKYFILLAALALTFSFASCNKDPKPDDKKDEPVVMKPAATADVAKKVSFSAVADDSKPTYVVGDKKYKILSIEFTESARFVMLRKYAGTTKGDDDVEVITGSYTENNGTYTCTSDAAGEFNGSVEASNNGSSANVSITTTNEDGNQETQNVQGNVSATSSGSTEKTNASRAWKVNSSLVVIAGNGVSLNKGFTGFDLGAIASYASSNGVSGLDASKFAGYSVTSFIFTGNNTLTITLAGAKDLYGSYTLNGESFSYTVETGGTNELINASAGGSLTFPADGQAELTFGSSFKGYDADFTLYLSEIK